MVDRHYRFGAVLALFLSAFACIPLLQPRFFATSDGLYHLYRLMEYDTVIRQGVWYPRWAPDFFYGFGMPLFNFYAPLSYYLAEGFHLLGAGYLDSFRLLAAAAMAISGFGAYLYARQFLPALPALLAAVVYDYAPYHLLNLYYRGDLPEYLAYVWYPLILWAAQRLVSTGLPRFAVLGAVFYAALILTHNLSAFIFSGFLIIYAVASLARSYYALRCARDVLLGGLRLASLAAIAWALTAFFWIPALLEKHLVQFDRLLIHYNFHYSFPSLTEFFSTDLVHRYGVIFRTAEVYAYRLGLLQGVFLLLGLAVLIWQVRRISLSLRLELLASALCAAVAIFLIFSPSTWLWENLPLLNLTQFSWRLLAFLGLPIALLAGFVVARLPARITTITTTLAISAVIMSSVAALTPIGSDVTDGDISPRGSLAFELAFGPIGTSAAAEYLPAWVKERPATSPVALSTVLGEPPSSYAPITADLETATLQRRANEVVYSMRASKDAQFVSDVLYFPGWLALLDGRQVTAGLDDPSGMVRVAIPAGEHTLTLRFVETRLRSTANIFSATIALLLLAAVVIKHPRLPRPTLRAGNLLIRERFKLAILATVLAVTMLGKIGYDAAYRPSFPHPSAINVTLGDVVIEGYGLSGGQHDIGSAIKLPAGSKLDLTVFWRMEKVTEQPFKIFARLTNHHDQIWAYAESGEQVARSGVSNTSGITLMLPLATPPGVYLIELGVMSRGKALEMRRVALAPIMPRDRGASIGPVLVQRALADRPESKLVTTGAVALSEPVNFANQIKLLDLALSDDESQRTGRPGAPLRANANGQGWQATAGESIHIDMVWQASQRQHTNWTITSRLVAADRTLLAIRDSQPADALFPTSFWREGEVVRDQLNLALPPELAPGDYNLEIEVVSRNGNLTILDNNRNPAGPTLRIGTIAVAPARSPANAAAVSIQKQTRLPMSGGLVIRGFSLGRGELRPGDTLDIDILWEATGRPDRDLIAKVDLTGADGSTSASESHGPAGDSYPTPLWRKGEVLRGRFKLRPRPSTVAGTAQITVELLDRSTATTVARQALDSVRILARERPASSDPSRVLRRTFDGKIGLLGFDLSSGSHLLLEDKPMVDRSAPFVTNIHWQALAEMRASYTVFAQVLDSAGRLVAQHDSPPQAGKAPTTAWALGETIDDPHSITIPSTLPAGEYSVIIGVYDGVTGKRLPVEGGGDYITLAYIGLPDVPAAKP